MSEREVRVGPGINFGRPKIRNSCAEAAADMVWAGESLATVADEYGLDVPEVLLACWFVARYGSWSQRTRWRAWLKENEEHLWANRPDLVVAPPGRVRAAP